LISGANATFNAIKSNFTIYGVLLGIDDGLDVLTGFGNLGTDCINGILSLPTTLSQYTAFL